MKWEKYHHRLVKLLAWAALLSVGVFAFAFSGPSA
jgi:hypothetical protein